MVRSKFIPHRVILYIQIQASCLYLCERCVLEISLLRIYAVTKYINMRNVAHMARASYMLCKKAIASGGRKYAADWPKRDDCLWQKYHMHPKLRAKSATKSRAHMHSDSALMQVRARDG